CPKGRRAEDGRIPEHYPLQETPTDSYPERTEWNVRDSDATLILTRGKPDRGTALTIKLARRYGKPHHIADLGESDAVEPAHAWLISQAPASLNIAGPRGDSRHHVYENARNLLRMLFANS